MLEAPNFQTAGYAVLEPGLYDCNRDQHGHGTAACVTRWFQPLDRTKGVTPEMNGNTRVAVVTGGTQGIGRRTAELLADRGYRLAIIDIHLPAETMRAIEAIGREAMAYTGDITDEETVHSFAKEVVERYGRIDVLVNNAGISLISAAEETTLGDYRRVLEVNLIAPFLLAKTFGQQMLDAGSGSIVNVASVAGLLGISDRAAYNASKHGLIGLTRTLAAEWGGRGVRVNAVCPGWVKTEMDAADQAGGTYSDADITGRVPMARFAIPDDIARAIAFLADAEESSFVNGQCLAVDGGWSADGSWESLRLRKR
jgi:NAD(P)-dependent dehydrogenase (short-subunit alcohol dehydrogenase family)